MIIVPPAKQSACGGNVGPGVMRFFALAMVIAGAGMLLGMWFMQDRARRSQSWPTTLGTVLEARVEERSGEKKKYRPIIRYAYAVNGAAYESDRYSFGSTRQSKNAADGLCAKYPPGSQVQVHYDPARPSEAVLILPPAGGTVPLGIAGALVLAAGALVFTLSFRSLPSLTAPSAASA
jgi:hypothetical protein